MIDPSIRLKLARKTEKDPIVEMSGDQGRKTIFIPTGTNRTHRRAWEPTWWKRNGTG